MAKYWWWGVVLQSDRLDAGSRETAGLARPRWSFTNPDIGGGNRKKKKGVLFC